MAILLEFIDLIVPVAVIRQKYPGGWEQCLRDHEELIGRRVWYDTHLFRDGAMGRDDMGLLVEAWKARGFESFGLDGDAMVWKDMCVAESLFGGATLRCDWIAFGTSDPIAYLRGTEPGDVIGRQYFRKSDD
ncbi:MAG: hypothetical protein ABIW82_18315 [Dokdonella sp.]